MSKYVLLLLALPVLSQAADQSNPLKSVRFSVEKRIASTSQRPNTFQPFEYCSLPIISTEETFLHLEQRVTQKYGRQVKFTQIPRPFDSSVSFIGLFNHFDTPNEQIMNRKVSSFPPYGPIHAVVHYKQLD